MHITQIHIDGFGKWQNVTFPVNPQLQVFYGANETGKTTIQKFISSVLFGFATAKHPADQYLPKTGAGYGGSLTFLANDAYATKYQLRRTAGKNGGDVELTNLTANQVMPPELLARLLGPVDRTLNDATFNFDLNGLQLLTTVTQPDLMANVQRVGAIGSAAWIQLAEEFDKNADELYKPRGQKPTLNQQLATYHKLQQELATAEAAYPQFVQRQRDIQSGQQAIAQYATQITELSQRRDELATIQRLWPTFEKYQAMKTTLPDVNEKLITAEDYADFLKLQTQREQLMQTAVQQVAQLKAQNEDTPSDLQFYMDHQGAFKAQAASFDEIETAIHERQFSRQQVASLAKEHDQIVADNQFKEPLPTPLTDRELEQVKRVNTQSSAPTTTTKTREQWITMGVGAVLLLLGLVMTSGVKWLFVLLGLAGIAGGWFNVLEKMRTPASQAPSDKLSMDQIGRDHHLTGIPVERWQALQPDIRRLEQLSQQSQTLQTKSHQLNEDINQFFEHYQFAGEYLSLANMSAADALLKARQYTSANELAVATVQGRSQQRLQLIRKNSEIQSKLDDVTHQLRDVMQRYQVQEPADFEDLYQQQLQLADQTAEHRALSKQLTPEWLAKLSVFKTLADVVAAHEKTKTDLQNCIDQRDATQQDVANQQAIFTQQSQDETVPVLRQRLANQETAVTETTQQWLVDRLSAQWINGALNVASADRLPEIVKRAQAYFATLTMAHYNKIEFVDQTIQATTTNGTVFEVGELSRGTAEQLYIALRLGFASVMADRTAMPLIIDDAFVDFDHSRRQAMLSLLKQLSEQTQVIYFTADEQALASFDDTEITRLSNVQ
ncbi:MAG TPA: hypothetical protein DCW31_02250 [Lactobacillus sp.]|nr:hypothetical protein [Lactobacillus sp.]